MRRVFAIIHSVTYRCYHISNGPWPRLIISVLSKLFRSQAAIENPNKLKFNPPYLCHIFDGLVHIARCGDGCCMIVRPYDGSKNIYCAQNWRQQWLHLIEVQLHSAAFSDKSVQCEAVWKNQLFLIPVWLKHHIKAMWRTSTHSLYFSIIYNGSLNSLSFDTDFGNIVLAMEHYSTKEQTVLDLFTLVRESHYDAEDEKQGMKKLCIWTADSYFKHVLRPEVLLCYAQVSYSSLHSVYTVLWLKRAGTAYLKVQQCSFLLCYSTASQWHSNIFSQPQSYIVMVLQFLWLIN